jgi:hypothetical protein
LLQTVSLCLVLLAAIWLVGVGLLMAFRPAYAAHLCDRMGAELQASNWRVHVPEQLLRVLAGGALILRAAASKAPLFFSIFGWILVVSSIILLVLPVRVHGGFGHFLRPLLRPQPIRLLSPVPVIAGIGLGYFAT